MRIKRLVYQANLDLVKHGLVQGTWGNASARYESGKWMIIKPSGVDYSRMSPEDMVVVDIASGKCVENGLVPSCDTPTHRCLYLEFSEINGVVHTHSIHASSWAQACLDLPILGTTAADCFAGDIPCTRKMTVEELETDYEWQTGKVIADTFRSRHIHPLDIPAVLVASHGPFTWGKDLNGAVESAIVLEQTTKMAFLTCQIAPNINVNSDLFKKHFSRKHGPNSYYGQEMRDE